MFKNYQIFGSVIGLIILFFYRPIFITLLLFELLCKKIKVALITGWESNAGLFRHQSILITTRPWPRSLFAQESSGQCDIMDGLTGKLLEGSTTKSCNAKSESVYTIDHSFDNCLMPNWIVGKCDLVWLLGISPIIIICVAFSI